MSELTWRAVTVLRPECAVCVAVYMYASSSVIGCGLRLSVLLTVCVGMHVSLIYGRELVFAECLTCTLVSPV